MKNYDLKQANRAKLLTTLYYRDYSRAGLATKLGLSKSVVSGIVDVLEGEGLIKEIGLGNSGELGGKRPIILSVNRKGGLVAAIHIDQKNAMVAIADMKGSIIASKHIPIKYSDDYTVLFQVILHHVDMLMAAIPVSYSESKLIACGISTKGLVDTNKGILKYTSAFDRWSDVPISEYFSNYLGIKTFVDNDARAFTYLRLLQSKKPLNGMICCVTLESGVGTGVMLNGNVITGAYFGAVNFAHTIIDVNGPLCRCGKHGCWESLASTNALLQKIGQDEPDYADISIEEAVLLYQKRDAVVSDAVLNYFCHWAAVGLSNVLSVFNPEEIYVYACKGLIDEMARKRILDELSVLCNHVTSQSKVFFEEMLPELHIKSAAALAIKNIILMENNHN